MENNSGFHFYCLKWCWKQSRYNLLNVIDELMSSKASSLEWDHVMVKVFHDRGKEEGKFPGLGRVSY